MWLSKLERKWLKYYLDNVNFKDNGELDYTGFPQKEMETKSAVDLCRMLSDSQIKKELLAALNRLIKRKLLIAEKQPSYDKMNEYFREAFGINCKLTVSGWDLANKYRNFLSKWGLFFNEYRDCGLGFVLGLLGGLLTHVLIGLCDSNQTQPDKPSGSQQSFIVPSVEDQNDLLPALRLTYIEP